MDNNSNLGNSSNPNLQPIREEFDLGEKKKQFKGKTIKIKKLVKKESGSFTLRETLLHGDDSQDTSGILNTSNDMILQNQDFGKKIQNEIKNPENLEEKNEISMTKKTTSTVTTTMIDQVNKAGDHHTT